MKYTFHTRKQKSIQMQRKGKNIFIVAPQNSESNQFLWFLSL